MPSVRCKTRFIVVAALVGALFVQLLPAGVFAAEGDDPRFDDINRLLNDPEMLRWLLDTSKFPSLERRNFLNKNAFILGNFVFELNFLKNKLLELEKILKGINEAAAFKVRAEINNIDNILTYKIGNETLSGVITQKRKLAEVQAPNVADVLKNEALFLEIFKEVHVPGLSGIPDLFSGKVDKDAVKKSLELISKHLNEKIAYILETLKLVDERSKPVPDETPPGEEPESPTPPKSPEVGAATNMNFALSVSARTVDAAIKIAQGEAPARRFKTISSNGIAIAPEIKDGNLYLNVAGGDLDPDSVSVDAGEGVIDTLGDFFFGGIEPKVSGNGFSFVLDAKALAGKPLNIAFTVKSKVTAAAAALELPPPFYPLYQIKALELLVESGWLKQYDGKGIGVTVSGPNDEFTPGSSPRSLNLVVVSPHSSSVTVSPRSKNSNSQIIAISRDGIKTIPDTASIAIPAGTVRAGNTCVVDTSLQLPSTISLAELIQLLTDALWAMGQRTQLAQPHPERSESPLRLSSAWKPLTALFASKAYADQPPGDIGTQANEFNNFWKNGVPRINEALRQWEDAARFGTAAQQELALRNVDIELQKMKSGTKKIILKPSEAAVPLQKKWDEACNRCAEEQKLKEFKKNYIAERSCAVKGDPGEAIGKATQAGMWIFLTAWVDIYAKTEEEKMNAYLLEFQAERRAERCDASCSAQYPKYIPKSCSESAPATDRAEADKLLEEYKRRANAAQDAALAEMRAEVTLEAYLKEANDWRRELRNLEEQGSAQILIDRARRNLNAAEAKVAEASPAARTARERKFVAAEAKDRAWAAFQSGTQTINPAWLRCVQTCNGTGEATSCVTRKPECGATPPVCEGAPPPRVEPRVSICPAQPVNPPSPDFPGVTTLRCANYRLEYNYSGFTEQDRWDAVPAGSGYGLLPCAGGSGYHPTGNCVYACDPVTGQLKGEANTSPDC